MRLLSFTKRDLDLAGGFYTTCCVFGFGCVGHRQSFQRNSLAVYSQFGSNWKPQSMKVLGNE